MNEHNKYKAPHSGWRRGTFARYSLVKSARVEREEDCQVLGVRGIE